MENPNSGDEITPIAPIAPLILKKSDEIFDEMCDEAIDDYVFPDKESSILEELTEKKHPLQSKVFIHENGNPTYEELKKNNLPVLFRALDNCYASLPENCWSKDTIVHFAKSSKIATFITEHFPNLSWWMDEFLNTKVCFAILLLMDEAIGKPRLKFKKGHWRELATNESMLTIISTIHYFDKTPFFATITGLKITKLKNKVFNVEHAFPLKYPNYFSERIQDFICNWTDQVFAYYKENVGSHDLLFYAKRMWIVEHLIQTIIRNLIVFPDYFDFEVVLQEFPNINDQFVKICFAIDIYIGPDCYDVFLRRKMLKYFGEYFEYNNQSIQKYADDGVLNLCIDIEMENEEAHHKNRMNNLKKMQQLKNPPQKKAKGTKISIGKQSD